MKTSLDIPDDLWKAAKHLAVEEHKDLRDIIIEALKDHLKKKKGHEDTKKDQWMA
jgi:predicted transcriptional regulator